MDLSTKERAWEVAGFMLWAAAIAAHFANIMGVWIVFFRHVVGDDGVMLKEKKVVVWVLWFWLAICWRQMIKRRSGMLIARVLDHVEVFIFCSMACGISTNITFFLHTPNPTLYDVGFHFVPEQSVDSFWRPLSDIMTVNLPFVMVVMSFLWTRAERCQLFVDWTRMMAIMYGLRLFCIPVTSLPGPAPHCLAANKDYLAPTDWIDMLTWMGPLVGKFGTCGDLLFSGHSAYCGTTLLLMVRRCEVRYPTSARGRAVRWCFAAAYFVGMCVLAISGRKHYTVDMVLGTIIASLSFFNFEHSWNRDQCGLLAQNARLEGRGLSSCSDTEEPCSPATGGGGGGGSTESGAGTSSIELTETAGKAELLPGTWQAAADYNVGGGATEACGGGAKGGLARAPARSLDESV